MKARYAYHRYITPRHKPPEFDWQDALLFLFGLAWQNPSPPGIKADRYWVAYTGSGWNGLELEPEFRLVPATSGGRDGKAQEASLKSQIAGGLESVRESALADLVPWPPRRFSAVLNNGLQFTTLAAIDFLLQSATSRRSGGAKKKRGPYRVKMTDTQRDVLEARHKYGNSADAARAIKMEISNFCGHLKRADKKAVKAGYPSVFADRDAVRAVRATKSVKAHGFGPGQLEDTSNDR